MRVTDPELLAIIRRIYEEMCHVERGERVLIIADSRTPADITNAFFDEGLALGTHTSLLLVPVPPPALQTSIGWSPTVTSRPSAA
jgi:hypothetical protein